MELTTTAAVATSPCVPPGIVRVRCGSPFSTTVSAGWRAPTYILSSMKIFSLPGGDAARDLMHAGDLARGHFEEFRLDDLFSDYRLDGFRNIVKSKSQAIGNHGDGFRQAVMFDDAGGDLRAEFFGRHACANFFLQRQAALGGVHDAHGAEPINALRDGAEGERELVHHEAGIHAGADEGDAFFFCCGV